MVKRINTMTELHQLMVKASSQHQNGRFEFTHNNINLKHKQAKCPNQKTQTGKLDKNFKTHRCAVCKHISHARTHRLKIKGWMKICQANGDKKKAGVAILVSDKMDFKPAKIKRDKEGHYIMVKESMQQELMILNIFALNTGASRYIK